MALKDKNIWILIVFILSGLVIGGLIGQVTGNISWLKWLAYGQEFGLQNPIVLNLGVLTLTFGLMFNINIASIIGLLIAVFVYKKMI